MKTTILAITAMAILAVSGCSSSDSTATTSTTTTSTTTTTTTSTPTYTPSVSAFSNAGPHNITISTTTSGAAICYSTSATPVCNAAKTGCTTGTLYSAAVSVSNATNLRAIACKSGNNDSSVKSVTYTMNSTYGTLSASVTPTSATLGATCIDSVNTMMDATLPDRIKTNFKCQTGYVDGTDYVLKSVNLPNHTSFYYCSLVSGGSCAVDKRNASLWAALPGGNTSAGTNTIFVQNLEFKIPSTPTLKTGTLTGTQNGYVAVGLTVNGLAIFNNAAAPPDTLAAEAATFDGFDGHPQNAGVYHHHAGVRKVGISGTDNNDANLIGIALDGYLIYGKKCDNATAGTGDDVTLTASSGSSDGSATGITGASATTLDQLHGHTTTTIHLSTPTYHYHMASDPTATIDTLLGSYFRGVAGTITN